MGEPFYKDGLSFKCQRCSACCRFEPGYVFLSQKDIDGLSAALRYSNEDFINTYCRIIDINSIKRLSLKEKSNYDCIFWADGGCIVYKHRPLQCRGFPFWSPFLVSQETWDNLATKCPGVNQGPHYSQQQIAAWLEMRRMEPLIAID